MQAQRAPHQLEMEMKLITQLATLALSAAIISSPAAAVSLDGGTETFTFPENIDNMRASITVTNNTKTLICDFVVKVLDSNAEAPPFMITEIKLDDPNQAAENWDVDDNNNGALEAGENDDAPPAAAAKVRIQERGKDDCLGRGRTGSLEIKFDSNPGRGDRIKISPTSASGGVVFVAALPVSCAVVEGEDVLFATGEFGVVNNSGATVSSFPVTTNWGVEVVDMFSPTHGGYFDFSQQRYVTDKPFTTEEVMALEYELSGFNPDGSSTTVCLGEKGDVKPVDNQQVERRRR